eukprot:TRINITY_DN38106_c0_g1_i2.p1 TRINITY_DN38106_c0_g1~~TRINITY_DN38106_c0_g1_i2.p1  ORF type:complete len:354 (-),score=96.25 TRINITY_DN38106_c0_g1_i2:113-1174(-)
MCIRDSSYALFEVWEDGVRTRLAGSQKVAKVVVNRSDQESKYRDLLLNPPRLEFRQWLYFKEPDRDMVLLEFAELRQCVLSGDLAYKPQETIGLGALSLQHDFGDHNPDVHQPGFLASQGQLTNFVPSYVIEGKGAEMVQHFEQLLFGMHSKLVGMTKEQSALEYLVQVSTWPLFGMTVFEAQWINKATATEAAHQIIDMPAQGLLGVNEQGLHYLTAGKQRLVRSWCFAELNSWASSDKHFGFVVGELEAHHRLVFATTKGPDMSSLVQGYIDAIVNRRDRSMQSPNMEDASEDSSTRHITCRDRALSSMDLRDLGDLLDESQFDVWHNIPLVPDRGRVGQLRAQGSVRMTV